MDQTEDKMEDINCSFETRKHSETFVKLKDANNNDIYQASFTQPEAMSESRNREKRAMEFRERAKEIHKKCRQCGERRKGRKKSRNDQNIFVVKNYENVLTSRSE